MNTGQAAYEGYKAASDGKSLISGGDLPAWDDQSPEIRAAWQAAADTVLEYAALLDGDNG